MSRIVDVDQEFIDDFGDPMVNSFPHHGQDHIQYDNDPSPEPHPTTAPMFDESLPVDEAIATLERHGCGGPLRNLCSAVSLACVFRRLEQLQLALARIDDKALRDEATHRVKQVLFP